jgi:hypothetical protein
MAGPFQRRGAQPVQRAILKEVSRRRVGLLLQGYARQ